MFPTLMQLKYLLGGIQHGVTVFGKWIFDGNITFELSITFDDIDYCCTN